MMDGIIPVSKEFTPLLEYEAALDWWREAGVDCDFEDEARDWLEAAAPPPEAEKPAVVLPKKPREQSPLDRALAQGAQQAGIGGARETWPSDLASFREYWMREPTLDEGALRARVPPRGPERASLMVLVGQPDEEDREVLLSGPQGRVLEGFLRAPGLDMADLYLASALPRRSALPDWNELAERGLGAVVRHHIALAKPARLLVFGRGLAPLLDDEEGADRLIAPALENLARSATRRQRFWNNWLEWTD